MLEGHISEGQNILQGQVDQQRQSHALAYIGYIAEYFPEDATCTVYNPNNSNTDPNNPNPVPMLSNRIPLGTGLSGLSNGKTPINDQIKAWGIQIAPLGGGTQNEPQAGEQVLVLRLNAEIGYEACAFLLYNDMAQPPGGQDMPVIGGQLKNGEILLVTPSGTITYFDIDGNLKIITQVAPNGMTNQTGNLSAVANGGIALRTAVADTVPDEPDQYDIDVTAHQDVNVNADRDINLTAVRDLKLDPRDINVSCDRNLNIAIGTNMETLVTGNQDTVVSENQTNHVLGTSTNTVDGAETRTTTGPLLVGCGNMITISAAGEIAIGSDTLIEILAPAINAGALTEALYPLLTEVFLTLFNAHTHGGVAPGVGHTGPPDVPIPPTYPNVTTVFQAG